MKSLRIGFESALSFWRTVRLADHPIWTGEPEGRVYGTRELALGEQVERARDLCAADGPLDVVVPDVSSRLGRRGDVRSRVWAGPLLERHLLLVGDGISVCRPVVVFVQLATLMDDISLAEVGYELVGNYALAKDSRRGFESDAEPLATMEELRAYASAARALGVRGAARAVRALGLMADNSNSPKESCVGILLALPRVRGGAGVPGFRMNVTIRLPEELADTLGQRTIIPDFSWPNGTVGEYDSDQEHLSPAARARDERKRRAFRSVGMDCITMTKGTFRSNAELNLLVGDLEGSLRLQRRPPTARILEARARLRERLFGPESEEAALEALHGKKE